MPEIVAPISLSDARADAKAAARPRASFRVGVTGASKLENPTPIQALAAAVLTDISDHVTACARDARARRVYDATAPLLRLISPLADGADRLVANAAPPEFQLDAVLPFPEAAYKTTFKAENAEADFDALLAQAHPRILILDGDPADTTDRRRSYEAVGRLVVRNCDLLIAIWDDDTPARGKGGTEDTVQFALRAGVPVWWIDATGDRPPRWLQDTLDQPRLGTPDLGTPDRGALPARDALRDYIARVILPPEAEHESHAGLWERGIACLRHTLGLESDPLLALLHEHGLPNHQIWSVHDTLTAAIKRHGATWHARRNNQQPPVAAKPDPPADTPKRAWHRALIHHAGTPFRRGEPRKASSFPARLSLLYQHRYRTSYLFVFILGAIALISSVIGLGFPRSDVPMTILEFLSVYTILALVLVNEIGRWHERYVSYRMLGELLRLSNPLRQLGWSLAGSRVNNMAHSTRRNWVAWLFAALTRAEPMATGDIKTTLQATKDSIVTDLLKGQIEFHERRQAQTKGAAHLFGQYGSGLFFAALILVTLRLGFWATGTWTQIIPWLSLFGSLLPAFSAAIFGFRAYEEFEVLAEQSKEMTEALVHAREKIERVRLDKPVASQVLGEELFDAATIMLSDVEGWAQLFRLKAVEA